MNEYNEIDVLIIGYGAAGANAAIAAHDAGSRVLILEKQAHGGGNSAVCAGAMVVPENIDEAIKYYRALACGTVDEQMICAFAEAMVGIPDLLSSLGVEYKSEPTISPSFTSLMNGRLKQLHINPTGENGFRFLEKQVKDRQIDVLTNIQVKTLIQEPKTKEIHGAIAQYNGKDITLMARRGVILSCGGYGANPNMIANFNVPGIAEHIFTNGSPGNTGDGISLATQAGAVLWHMSSVEWGRFCAKVPSEKYNTAVGYGIGRTNHPGSYLFVNKYGKRFMAEDAVLSHCKSPLDILYYDHKNAEYPNLPAYMIFDHTQLTKRSIAPTADMFYKRRGGIVGYALGHQIYDWSANNQAELDKGWIIKANSVCELANKIGIQADLLEKTVNQHNQACADGNDAQFGRKAKSLIALETPPYYAIELGLTLINTQGGPKRNANCQVLDHKDSVIPRLYAAGELGAFFGFLYQIGSNYPEAWATGHIAGKMVASESSLRK